MNLCVLLLSLILFNIKCNFSNKNKQIEVKQSYNVENVEQDRYIENNSSESISNRSIPDSTNMVNYDMSNKTLSYETFDENNYTNRNENISSINLITDENLSRTVHDSDARTEITNAKESPYLQTAYVRSIYYNVYNSTTRKYVTRTFAGTAFLEGQNLAVSAGHVVYEDVTSGDDYEDSKTNPRFPDKIEFYFGCSGNSDFSQGSSYKYYAEAKIVNIEYEYYTKQKSNQDWSAIQLDRNIGYLTGWYGKIANYRNSGTNIYSWGYPGDKTKGTLWQTTGEINTIDNFKYYYKMDTYHGQSGSPIFMKNSQNQVFVCRIHTTSGNTYNSGTIINSLIFAYLNSYVTSSDTSTPFYEYLELSSKGYNSGTYTILIQNNTSHQIETEYNEKMCFDADAKNWNKLNDIKTVTIKPYSYTKVSIKENWFATTIAISYIKNDKRLVSYANGLSNNSLTQYTNKIDYAKNK